MELGIASRFKNAWNAFKASDRAHRLPRDQGPSYYSRPDRPRLTRGNERSTVTSVFNRLAIDVASVDIRHVTLNEDGLFLSEIDSGLNECLSAEANIDQSGRALVMDIVLSMLDEGCVAVVPVDIDTDDEPTDEDSFDVLTLRTGKIVEWKPWQVKVRLYNDRTGREEEIWLDKSRTAIIENPLYAVVNEPNSTLQRLIRKLNLLDYVDEQSGSGKLDMILQVPYSIKTDRQASRAKDRLADIERQLNGSKFGIAYVDATEQVTQLNRPLENNLLKQVEMLTSTLYSQLGITQSVMEGTADEKTMLNYTNRTVEPILLAITEEFQRKFLTKTARSKRQAIRFYRDPFRLVPVSEIAEIADKMTRNEIMVANEIRVKVGLKPSDDPKANELRNSNIAEPASEAQAAPRPTERDEENQNE